MKESLEKAVKNLIAKAIKTEKSVNAMQYTQAALNAVQAIAYLTDVEKK